MLSIIDSYLILGSSAGASYNRESTTESKVDSKKTGGMHCWLGRNSPLKAIPLFSPVLIILQLGSVTPRLLWPTQNVHVVQANVNTMSECLPTCNSRKTRNCRALGKRIQYLFTPNCVMLATGGGSPPTSFPASGFLPSATQTTFLITPPLQQPNGEPPPVPLCAELHEVLTRLNPPLPPR